MKKLLIVIMLGTLAAPAFAQDTTDEVRVRGFQIELPTQPYRMFGDEFGQYRGGYELSNGQSLVMAQQGRRMYAKLSGGEMRELVAAAPNVFVARDRTLKITLERDKFDAYTGEVLIVPANASMADAGQVVRLRLVSAR